MAIEKDPPRYGAVTQVTATPECVDYLVQARKGVVHFREEMMEFQKDCAAQKDYVNAKWFSERAKEALAEWRAWTLWIGWLNGPCEGARDCEHRPRKDWPAELWDHCDRVKMSLELRFG